MKKWSFMIGVVLFIGGAFVFYNKLYYPPLPIENISKKAAFEQARHSENQIVPLSNESGIEWFITSERNIEKVDNMTKQLAAQHGWTFTLKEGSGLFFEKQGERLIATTEMWTSDYVLIDIPSHFNESYSQ